MNILSFPTSVLGEIIQRIDQKDFINVAMINKRLYKTILLYYPFNNYKMLIKLSDPDFNLILMNVNINSEVILRAIIINNRYKILKTYINKINPRIDNNWILRWSSYYGLYEIIKILLFIKNKNINPSTGNNNAIRMASHNGQYKIVELLLNDPRVDPSDNNNDAIRLASYNGHYKIVKLLLNDPRVDPSDNNNEALCISSENGHLEVVKLLLNDSRVDPRANNGGSMRWAFYSGYYEIVKLLLNDYRVDINDINNKMYLVKLLNLVITKITTKNPSDRNSFKK